MISNSGNSRRLEILAEGAKGKWHYGHSDHQQSGIQTGADGRLPYHYGYTRKLFTEEFWFSVLRLWQSWKFCIFF